MFCNLTIKNPTQKTKKIKIEADFTDDEKNGLLKEGKLIGYSVLNDCDYFIASKGKNNIEVVFIGEYGGNNQKTNRLLPDIKIVELDNKNID